MAPGFAVTGEPGPDHPSAATAGPSALTWLTPELAARLEAGEEISIHEIDGFPTETDDPTSVNPVPYTHIRPGSALGIPQFACTANFVFQQGDRLAIGTAGHCTFVGQQHTALVANPDTLTIGMRNFGVTIVSTGNGGVGNDFALIEVHAGSRPLIHPAVALIDGPCGARAANVGDTVQYYGHGQGVGAGGQPRSGVVLSTPSQDFMGYVRLPAGSGGDSGSPVRLATKTSDLDAAPLAATAVHTHGSLPVLGYGTTITRVFEIIQASGTGPWELVDSPTCTSLP